MGYTYYSLTIMIPENNELTFGQVQERLEKIFASRENTTIDQPKPTHIRIRRDNWYFHVHWYDDSTPVEESPNLARIYGRHREDQDVIASCKRWVTTYGSDDPDMDYFNDYCYVLGMFEEIPNVYILDYDRLYKSGEEPPKKATGPHFD